MPLVLMVMVEEGSEEGGGFAGNIFVPSSFLNSFTISRHAVPSKFTASICCNSLHVGQVWKAPYIST